MKQPDTEIARSLKMSQVERKITYCMVAQIGVNARVQTKGKRFCVYRANAVNGGGSILTISFFSFFPINCQPVATSVENVSARSRTQTLVITSAWRLQSVSEHLNVIEINPWTKNEYLRVFVLIR